MKRKAVPRNVFVILLIVGVVVQHAWYWPQLPERMATHFGANGHPNDWMSRTAATLLLAGLQIGIPLFLVFVNALAGRLPDSMLNIPNREYWLSPERKEATLVHMNRMMNWITALTAVFLLALSHLTFLANQNRTDLNLPIFATTLGLFLICVFMIAGYSMTRFWRSLAKRG